MNNNKTFLEQNRIKQGVNYDTKYIIIKYELEKKKGKKGEKNDL